MSLSPAAGRRVGPRSVRLSLACRTDASAEGYPCAEEESGMPEEWKHFKEKAQAAHSDSNRLFPLGERELF